MWTKTLLPLHKGQVQMIKISESKQMVINAEGHTLVMGGPGSGKTTVALLKAQHIIDKGILKQEQRILFLSFARATVLRVEQHAKNIIKKLNMDHLEISTYHSFEWNILRSHGHLLVMKKIRLLPPHEASVRLSRFTTKDEKEKEMMRLFNNEGLLHFDIFATKSADLLSRSRTLRSIISTAYPIIILDEFQDTNNDEWKLIKHLGQKSTLIALADPEQRIYGFRGADPARIRQFINDFNPQTFDFGTENNRSNGTDIVEFGNELLTGANKNKQYNDVKIFHYTPLKNDMHLIEIKTYLLGRMKDNKNKEEWSLAILVPSNSLMVSVSDFMRNKQSLKDGRIIPSIYHEVAVDTHGPSLAANLIAFMLDFGSRKMCKTDTFLHCLCNQILGRSGENAVSKKDQLIADDLVEYITKYDSNKTLVLKRQKKLLVECQEIINECNEMEFTGDVSRDWISSLNIIASKESPNLKIVGKDARFIKLLRKGSMLNSNLGQLWRMHGNYNGASDAVKNALAQEHFAMTTKTWSGINIMTIHKSKGKEFDEVIIYEGSFSGKIVRNDAHIDDARLNLRVAVTRAKMKVMILTPAKAPCILL